MYLASNRDFELQILPIFLSKYQKQPSEDTLYHMWPSHTSHQHACTHEQNILEDKHVILLLLSCFSVSMHCSDSYSKRFLDMFRIYTRVKEMITFFCKTITKRTPPGQRQSVQNEGKIMIMSSHIRSKDDETRLS